MKENFRKHIIDKLKKEESLKTLLSTSEEQNPPSVPSPKDSFRKETNSVKENNTGQKNNSRKENDLTEETLEKIEKTWYGIQYKASGFNPDKEKAWQQISQRITGKVKSITIPLRRLYQGIAAAVILLLISISTVYILLNEGTQKTVTYKYEALNGKSKVCLPDGTQVWLAPYAEITYTNNFRPENRNIQIEGKVYLEVRKDSLHPFSVTVNQSVIQVWGTSFNINSTSAELTVSLLSGKISFQGTPNETPRWIRPGQSVTRNKTTGHTTLQEGDVTFDALWAQDKLKIEEKTLGEVVKYLNQWYNVEISLSPQLENKYKYTFTVTTEQLDEILRMMARINPLEITYDKNKVSIK